MRRYIKFFEHNGWKQLILFDCLVTGEQRKANSFCHKADCGHDGWSGRSQQKYLDGLRQRHKQGTDNFDLRNGTK